MIENFLIGRQKNQNYLIKQWLTRSHKQEIIKKAELRDGDNILDVACGNGYLLENSPKRRELMPLV